MQVDDKRSRGKAALGHLLFFLAAAAVSAWLYGYSPLLGDPDELYHFRHAALYARGGLFQSAFPWTVYSSVTRYGADLWYGFHLLLLPFTSAADPVHGIKLAGIAVLTASLGLLYAAFVRLRVVVPAVWPLLILVSAPPAVMRMVLVRPHVLSLALLGLLLAVTLQRRPRAMFLTALALAWIHLNLVWAVPLVLAAVLLVRLRTERSVDGRGLLAAGAGLLLGWALRPNPLGAATLAWVQLVRWAAEKQAGTPLLVGLEAKPPDPAGLVEQFLPFLLLWLLAVILVVTWAVRKQPVSPDRSTRLWSALLLSVFFFELTVVGALRASDQWKVFAALLIAEVVTLALAAPSTESAERPARSGRVLAGVAAVVVALSAWRGFSPEGQRWLQGSVRPERLRPAAEWLAAHSREGEIVFDPYWQSFGELFFWNQQNRYVNGMDPIFLFAESPRRYWLMHHLATGEAVPRTCAEVRCTPENLEDTWTVLRNDFHAEYLVVEKNRSRNLFYAVANDPRFELLFDSEETAVYRVGTADRPGRALAPAR